MTSSTDGYTCQILSRRSNTIDYRPYVQHKLFLEDDNFDTRYNALLYCNEKLAAALSNTMRKHLSVLQENIVKELHWSEIGGVNILSNRKNHLAVITTGLSDADRGIMTTILTHRFELELVLRVVNVECQYCNSANYLLLEIAEALFRKCSASNGQSDVRIFDLLKSFDYNRIKQSPVQFIDEFAALHLNSGSSGEVSTTRSLTIVLQFAERISPDTLGDLCVQLNSFKWKYNLIAITTDSQPLPLVSYPGALDSYTISTHFSPTPWAIYDDFVADAICSSSVLPVSLPITLLHWIHQSFLGSSCCVSTIVGKMQSALGQHFQHRRAMLCMFQQVEWIREMKLSKLHSKASQWDPYVINRTIADLLSYLGVRDVTGTGLILTVVPAEAESTRSYKEQDPEKKKKNMVGGLKRKIEEEDEEEEDQAPEPADTSGHYFGDDEDNNNPIIPDDELIRDTRNRVFTTFTADGVMHLGQFYTLTSKEFEILDTICLGSTEKQVWAMMKASRLGFECVYAKDAIGESVEKFVCPWASNRQGNMVTQNGTFKWKPADVSSNSVLKNGIDYFDSKEEVIRYIMNRGFEAKDTDYCLPDFSGQIPAATSGKGGTADQQQDDDDIGSGAGTGAGTGTAVDDDNDAPIPLDTATSTMNMLVPVTAPPPPPPPPPARRAPAAALRAAEVVRAESLLWPVIIRNSLDDAWFQFMKQVRDSLVLSSFKEKDRDAARATHCTCALWADCKQNDGVVSDNGEEKGGGDAAAIVTTVAPAATQQLLSITTTSVYSVPLDKVNRVIKTTLASFQALQKLLQAIRKVSLSAASSSNAEATGEFVPPNLYRFVSYITDELEDHLICFEELVNNMDKSLSYNRLEKIGKTLLQQNECAASEAAAAAAAVVAVGLKETEEGTAGESNSAPVGDAQFNMEEPHFDMMSVLKGFLSDFVSFLKESSTKYFLLQRPKDISGVSVISSEDVAQVQISLESNIRSQYFHSLKYPKVIEGRPDACILYDKMRSCKPPIQELSPEWLEYFVSHCDVLSVDDHLEPGGQNYKDNSKRAKKVASVSATAGNAKAKAGAKADDDQDNEDGALSTEHKEWLKCRFVAALNELEKSGVIQCHRRSNDVIVITGHMYMWTN